MTTIEKGCAWADEAGTLLIHPGDWVLVDEQFAKVATISLPGNGARVRVGLAGRPGVEFFSSIVTVTVMRTTDL